jgi:hypothetical protein
MAVFPMPIHSAYVFGAEGAERPLVDYLPLGVSARFLETDVS